MATETEKLYTDNTATQTGAGTGTDATTAPATATSTATTPATSPYVTGNTSLDNYNNARFTQLNQLYDSNRDAALGQLESAHNRNMSDAQAAYDKISPAYQASRNEQSAEYERQRRNNNIQAAANGLNTGAGSQMQLAASNVYQTGQTTLQKAENEALDEANRNMLTMKEQYEADVANALAKNDSERAAALLNEYGQQYDRMMSEAKQMAAYGDFSLYTTLYGDTAAKNMERTWALQNPALAYTLGKISANDYFSMTGKWPNGYDAGGGSSSGGGGYGGYGYYGGSGGSGSGGGNGSTEISAQNIYDALRSGASQSAVQNAINEVASNKNEASQMLASINAKNQQEQNRAVVNALNNANKTTSSSKSTSSSSKGGSTTHKSSSGATHGGSGGKF